MNNEQQGNVPLESFQVLNIPKYLLTEKSGFESYLKVLLKTSPMEFFEPANLKQFDQLENVGFRIYHKKEEVDKYYKLHLKELNELPEIKKRKVSKVYNQILARLKDMEILAKEEIKAELPMPKE